MSLPAAQGTATDAASIVQTLQAGRTFSQAQMAALMAPQPAAPPPPTAPSPSKQAGQVRPIVRDDNSSDADGAEGRVMAAMHGRGAHSHMEQAWCWRQPAQSSPVVHTCREQLLSQME